MSENSYVCHFSAQVSQFVFLAYLIVLRLIATVTWNVRKLITPRFQCTSITNRVFSLFDRFRLLTTVWTEMWEDSYLRQFSAQFSSNRVLSLFDRFTAFYNFMTWNVRKRISPRIQCTSITNRVLSLFDRFSAFSNYMIKWRYERSSRLIRNLSNCEREAWKKFRLQRDSNPWPLRYRCSALPTELWSHNCWEQVNFVGPSCH